LLSYGHFARTISVAHHWYGSHGHSDHSHGRTMFDHVSHGRVTHQTLLRSTKTVWLSSSFCLRVQSSSYRGITRASYCSLGVFWYGFPSRRAALFWAMPSGGVSPLTREPWGYASVSWTLALRFGIVLLHDCLEYLLHKQVSLF
jgi:hypothetical protein